MPQTTPTSRATPRRLLTLVAVALPLAAGCTSNTGSTDESGGQTVSVTSSADACELSADTASSGTVTFEVKNTGDEVTEFYLYGENGERIVGEVENIGPGLSRNLVVTVEPGSYVTACKPGMSGDGIRDDFTVTDSGAGTSSLQGVDTKTVDRATEQYAGYVRDETDRLLAGTQRFVAAYKNGRNDRARTLYPRVRRHWERIEPVAESFGDLDPRMDLREADLAEGQQWTGWHRLEKDLWPPEGSGYAPLSAAQRTRYADRLMADTRDLHRRVQNLDFTAAQIGNGAKELLDEVAIGKVTGEEEAWSHTDLYDFQANVDGAREAFEALRPALRQKDPELAETLQRRFAALEKLLGGYRSGAGFVSYEELSTAQVRGLSDAVNALSEPLAGLTAAVTL